VLGRILCRSFRPLDLGRPYETKAEALGYLEARAAVITAAKVRSAVERAEQCAGTGGVAGPSTALRMTDLGGVEESGRA